MLYDLLMNCPAYYQTANNNPHFLAVGGVAIAVALALTILTKAFVER